MTSRQIMRPRPTKMRRGARAKPLERRMRPTPENKRRLPLPTMNGTARRTRRTSASASAAVSTERMISLGISHPVPNQTMALKTWTNLRTKKPVIEKAYLRDYAVGELGVLDGALVAEDGNMAKDKSRTRAGNAT